MSKYKISRLQQMKELLIGTDSGLKKYEEDLIDLELLIKDIQRLIETEKSPNKVYDLIVEKNRLTENMEEIKKQNKTK